MADDNLSKNLSMLMTQYDISAKNMRDMVEVLRRLNLSNQNDFSSPIKKSKIPQSGKSNKLDLSVG